MRIVTENNRRTKKEQTAPRCTKQNGSSGSLVAFRHRPTFRSDSDIAIFAGDFRRERGKFDVQFSLSRSFSSRASHLYETETGNCDGEGSVTIAVHRPKERGKGLPVREREAARYVSASFSLACCRVRSALRGENSRKSTRTYVTHASAFHPIDDVVQHFFFGQTALLLVVLSHATGLFTLGSVRILTGALACLFLDFLFFFCV